MKKISFLMLFAVVLMTVVSCRDTKKEEQKQVEEAVKTIDSVENAIDDSAENIEKVSNEAEEALKELDSI